MTNMCQGRYRQLAGLEGVIYYISQVETLAHNVQSANSGVRKKNYGLRTEGGGMQLA